MKPLTAILTRDDVRPEDRAAFDRMKSFDERIAKILADNGGEVTCPRCKKPAVGWPLRRGDRCNTPGAVHCLRDPQTVLDDIARRDRRKGRVR